MTIRDTCITFLGDSEKTARPRSTLSWRIASATLAGAIVLATGASAQSPEQGLLTPVFPGPIARVGKAVAIDGDTAVVVATQATFVFDRTPNEPSTWTQAAILPVGLTNARVDISGDTVIVGDVDTIGDGVAIVFERNHGGPNAWGEVARLTPSVLEVGNWFGWSVAIRGDTAVVGAIEWPAIFWKGPSEPGPGSAYVFERNRGGPNAWGEVQRLRASDGEGSYLGGPGDEFGYDVAVGEDMVLVGAPGDDVVPATGGRRFDVGAVYVFTRDRTSAAWQESGKLTAAATDQGDSFGQSIGLDGVRAIVAARGANPSPGTSTRGAAYIFKQESDSWREVATLRPSDAPPVGRFPESFAAHVSISDDIAVVADPAENGRRGPFISQFSGSAYVFVRDAGNTETWREALKLVSDAEPGDAFGATAAISGTTVIIGAPTGLIDGPGAAYVCELESISSTSGACKRQIPDVTRLVTMSDMTTACCDDSQFTISATFTNTSDVPVAGFFFEVAELTNGNLLLNADGGPGGLWATLTPDVGDGTLSPGETVTVQFVIGLASRAGFQFWVYPRGELEP